MLLPYDAALIAGAKTFQGKPCRHGHAGERYARKDRACVMCQRNRDAERSGGRQRAWREHNRAHVLNQERDKRARMNDAEREARRERKRAWKRDNPDKQREARSRYRKARQERLAPEREAVRLARVAEREAVKTAKAAKAHAAAIERERLAIERREVAAMRKTMRNRLKSHNRRAVKRGTNGIVTVDALNTIRILQNGCCAYCGTSNNLHLDHIIPIAKGGKHAPNNLQYLCAYHNISKKAQFDIDYRIKKGIPLLTPWDVKFGLIKYCVI